MTSTLGNTMRAKNGNPVQRCTTLGQDDMSETKPFVLFACVHVACLILRRAQDERKARVCCRASLAMTQPSWPQLS
jgi:hypothetical protein